MAVHVGAVEARQMGMHQPQAKMMTTVMPIMMTVLF